MHKEEIREAIAKKRVRLEALKRAREARQNLSRNSADAAEVCDLLSDCYQKNTDGYLE